MGHWDTMRWLGILALLGCGRVGFESRVAGDAGARLVVTPATSLINVGSKQPLAVSGGVPPYQLTLAGQGAMVGSTFVAPTRAGESRIDVADAEGRIGTATIDYRGDRLFVAGGFLGTAATASVLSSSDGVTWTMVGNLPAARGNGAFVVYDDRMFYLGGLDAANASTTTVYASTDGALWTQVGALPVANTGFTATVHAGELWYVGGATAQGNSGLGYHSVDGVTWTPAAMTVAPVRHESDVISRDGKLYVIGGHGDTAFLDDVQATIDGSSWSLVGHVTFAVDFPAAGELGDRAFRTCGTGCTTTETSLDLATWTAGGPLPDGERESPALVGFGDRMLLIGGGTTVLATTDGAVWTVIGSLPASRARTGAVQFTPH